MSDENLPDMWQHSCGRVPWIPVRTSSPLSISISRIYLSIWIEEFLIFSLYVARRKSAREFPNRIREIWGAAEAVASWRLGLSYKYFCLVLSRTFISRFGENVTIIRSVNVKHENQTFEKICKNMLLQLRRLHTVQRLSRTFSYICFTIKIASFAFRISILLTVFIQ